MNMTFIQCFTQEACDNLLAHGYDLLTTHKINDKDEVWVFLNNKETHKLVFENNNEYILTNRMNF